MIEWIVSSSILIFQLSRRDSAFDFHHQRGGSLSSDDAQIYESKSDFPYRRFDPEGCISLGKRDIEEMDDAGTGLGYGVQPDHDILRRQVRGSTPH